MPAFCSGFTLSGAFYSALKGGLRAAEWVKKLPADEEAMKQLLQKLVQVV